MPLYSIFSRINVVRCCTKLYVVCCTKCIILLTNESFECTQDLKKQPVSIVTLFVYRQKQDRDVSTENLEVDGCYAASFCGIDESSVDVSPDVTADLVADDRTTVRTAGKVNDDDDLQRTVSSHHHDTSTTSNNHTSSSGETTTSTVHCCLSATSSTIKTEPGVDERNNVKPRRENSERRHDNVGDVINASRCAQRGDDQQQCVHFTVARPSVSFSHRRDCPCRTMTSVALSSGITDGESRRRRRRRLGLSRLRRTELRRRSRTASDDKDDFGIDGAALKSPQLDVDRTAPSSNVISTEPVRTTASYGQNRGANGDIFAEFKSTAYDVVTKPSHDDESVHNITTEKQPQTSTTTSSVLGLSTVLTTARTLSETRPPSENEANERRTTNVAGESRMTNRCRSPVEKKRHSTSAESAAPRVLTTAAQILPVVSPWSFDIGRTPAADASGNQVAPLGVRRSLDRAVVSRSDVVNEPLAVSSAPVLRRAPAHCVIADSDSSNGSHGGSPSPIVAAPRCYASGAAKWRRCYGLTEKQRRDVITWMQTRRRGLVLAMPATLRCAVTALKFNAVALVNSPVSYMPRHVPILYPRYRLLFYPPSPSV